MITLPAGDAAAFFAVGFCGLERDVEVLDMAEPKTKQGDADVTGFVTSIADEGQRTDAAVLIELMQRVTGSPPAMWGTSMVGFGSYHYRYASGREGDWFLVGFAPRKQSLTVYVMDGFAEYDALLERLGKHSTGKSCLYIKRLDDVDMRVLEELLRKSVASVQGAATA
jgi:hypothetical protein